MMLIPLVRKRNSSASFAAFLAALAVALPSSVVGSFMSLSLCFATSCFLRRPFSRPKLMSLFASFFCSRISLACCSLIESWLMPCCFALRRFCCAGVFPMATELRRSRQGFGA